ncbi:MAG: hypothetical protein U9N49_02415 [Campylobacterota bacterium]|nr:hypothetical protein [Campylobacterota bacterium]
MSAGKVCTVGVNTVATGTTSTIGMVGALSGVGIVGLVAVGVWVHNKKKDEEVFACNQNMLKQEFEFMLGEVKKLQDTIFEKFNVKVDFLEKLTKEAEFGFKMYTKELIKDPAHNKKYEKIVKDFSIEAKKTIFHLKELESERLEEMDEKIKRITQEFDAIAKDETLGVEAQKMDEIAQKLQGEFESWEEKYSVVSEYQSTLDSYQKSLKAIIVQKGIEELIEGVEEQSVEILSPTQKLLLAIDEFKEKIKKYDASYARFSDITTQSKDKLKMVLESIKLDYGKAKEIAIWSDIYREDLAKLAKLELTDEVEGKITALQKQERISKEAFQSIADEINEIMIKRQERAILLERLKESLDGMGYSVIEEEGTMSKLENGEIIYLDSDDDNYKIMLKLSDEMKMTTRVVRMVATQEEKDNVTSYQRLEDIQAAHRWCSSYDRLTNLLRANGIEVDTTLRIEPEDDTVLYMVDESRAPKAQKESEKEGGDRVQYLDE